MAGKQKVNKATGRKKGKIISYYQFRWAPRKLRHMLKRNGWAFAEAWAKAHGHMDLLMRMKKGAA